VDANTTVDPLFQQAAAMEQALQEWNDTRRGPYTDTAANTIAMLRLPQNASILSSTPDPAAGPLSSNEELLFAEGFVPLSNIPLPSSGNFITILSIVTSPTSRGSVTLNSTDPFSPPVIDPNYLATDFDQHTAVQAMRDAFTILSARSFDGYVGAPYGPLAGLSTDEELLGYVRQHGVTINHGVGTAKMSPKDATWGVVDPDLKVKGVEGVRVVDASVFPEIPECHTMAPVYILAEKAADIIRKTYGFAV
jgi:choline dehydrogenase-like flavoprotein